MEQEANDLILGIDLQKQSAQVTYYHSSMREPVTVSLAGGQQLLPMTLWMDREHRWHFPDADPGKQDDAEVLYRIEGIYEKIDRQEDTVGADGPMSPEDLLSVYLGKCLDLLKDYRQENTRVHVMVTVAHLTEVWAQMIIAALTRLGIGRRFCYLQDHMTSFYYYAVSQKKELWNQDIALLEYEDGVMYGHVLQIDRSVKPAMARIGNSVSQRVDDTVRGRRNDQEWAREKDHLFYDMLRQLFERRNVTVSYLTGDFFQKSWAERSIQFLCHKRHAFMGENLYSKGACYAAIERAGLIPDRQMIFCGGDMVQVNMGMEMRIRGKTTYYPIVNAGANWYEIHHVCEFIPDRESMVRLMSRTMANGVVVNHLIPLRKLHDRPDRTLRLRMTVYFVSRERCKVEVEDLGFGGLYPSSGLVWEREILC